MNDLEILSPAGDFQKLKYAIRYGADAVYLAFDEFGMRTASKNFSYDELESAINYAHSQNVKVYLTVNTYPTNDDVKKMPEFFKKVEKLSPDAFIIADVGVMALAKKYAPSVDIHVSTQANVTNYETALAFKEMGAKRVVLARELSLENIKEIKKNVGDLELECFVHGAMCMSVSGRCSLSNYFTGRDANKGNCSHPCRWSYSISEEKRPGIYFPIEENDKGTFIFNSKDLCMIEYVKELYEAGVTSFKIEGRVKSFYYVATVTNAYKTAKIAVLNGKDYDKEYLLDEVKKVSNRHYTTGFYFNRADESASNYQTSAYERIYDVVGVVESYDEDKKIAKIIQKNKFSLGD